MCRATIQIHDSRILTMNEGGYYLLLVNSRPAGDMNQSEVQIDEMKYGHWKYNRGRYVEGVWIFGEIE